MAGSDEAPPVGQLSITHHSDQVTAAARENHTDAGAMAAAGQPISEKQLHLQAEIVRQVEFYFSDPNLPTDDFLLKQIKKNAEGYVPIGVIANFNKMKKLTRDLRIISAALKTSTQLQVSADGHKVKRLAPLPDTDYDEVRSRSVVAWNLPGEKPTIEQVIELFSKAGAVSMARIRRPEHPEPLLTRGMKTEVSKGVRDYYALVEYAAAEEAARAVELLNDESHWRTGLKVKALLQAPAQAAGRGRFKKGGDSRPSIGYTTRSRTPEGGGGAGCSVGIAEAIAGLSIGQNEGGEVAEERPKAAWEHQKRKNKADYAAWASANAASAGGKAANGGESSGGASEGLEEQKQPSQPRMPEPGSRGFGMGRGKPLDGAFEFKLAAASGSFVDE